MKALPRMKLLFTILYAGMVGTACAQTCSDLSGDGGDSDDPYDCAGNGGGVVNTESSDTTGDAAICCDIACVVAADTADDCTTACVTGRSITTEAQAQGAACADAHTCAGAEGDCVANSCALGTGSCNSGYYDVNNAQLCYSDNAENSEACGSETGSAHYGNSEEGTGFGTCCTACSTINFDAVDSVSACLTCDGATTGDCATATCASGFHTYDAGTATCAACSAIDFDAVDSVSACLTCDGATTGDCATATCASGFHTYDAGTATCAANVANTCSADSSSECNVGFYDRQDATPCSDSDGGEEACDSLYSGQGTGHFADDGTCCAVCTPVTHATLASCQTCSGATDATDSLCTAATCANGFHTYVQGFGCSACSVTHESLASCQACSGATDATDTLCTEGTCADGYHTYTTGSTCTACNEDEASIATCLTCGGADAAGCLTATCADGYHTYSGAGSTCTACNEDEASVATCLTCNAADAAGCLTATCADGYHTYTAGSTCTACEAQATGCTTHDTESCTAGGEQVCTLAADYYHLEDGVATLDACVRPSDTTGFDLADLTETTEQLQRSTWGGLGGDVAQNIVCAAGYGTAPWHEPTYGTASACTEHGGQYTLAGCPASTDCNPSEFTFDDDEYRAVWHFVPVCTGVTAPGGKCQLTHAAGYYGGSVTCVAGEFRNVAATGATQSRTLVLPPRACRMLTNLRCCTFPPQRRASSQP